MGERRDRGPSGPTMGVVTDKVGGGERDQDLEGDGNEGAWGAVSLKGVRHSEQRGKLGVIEPNAHQIGQRNFFVRTWRTRGRYDSCTTEGKQKWSEETHVGQREGKEGGQLSCRRSHKEADERVEDEQTRKGRLVDPPKQFREVERRLRENTRGGLSGV